MWSQKLGQARDGLSPQWRSRTAPEVVPDLNTTYYSKEQGKDWIPALETFHVWSLFPNCGTRRERAKLTVVGQVQDWWQGWVLSPVCLAWDTPGSLSEIHSPSKEKVSFQGIGEHWALCGWDIVWFLAHSELVKSLWLDDTPRAGHPVTLWEPRAQGKRGCIYNHLKYFSL